jgi:23S rRNA-/tRNA-specific pseudouridylate synthase
MKMLNKIPAIIAQTSHYTVLHKPAGLLVERSPYYPSVEAWLYDEIQQKDGRKTPFVGVVHRLDRAVSGVLLMANKKSYLQAFNEQFRLRQVEKTYHALLEVAPKEAFGTLKHWHLEDKMQKKAIVSSKPSKNATEVALSYKILSSCENQHFVEIDLHTGKFHQIRAQFAAIGCPIVGDIKYGATQAFYPDAIALHAHRLVVTEPNTGERLVFEAAERFV